MSRTSTPKYRIEISVRGYSTTPMAWRVKDDGPTTAKRLAAWIAEYIASLKIGVNQHISLKAGYIPVPHRAAIINQRTGETVATWTAPAFMAI